MKRLPAQNGVLEKLGIMGSGHIKIELINWERWYDPNPSLKYKGYIFAIFFDKRKVNFQGSFLVKTMVYRSNIYHFKMHKKNWEKNKQLKFKV